MADKISVTQPVNPNVWACIVDNDPRQASLNKPKNAIVDIRAGTGVLEATHFCAELFKMYEKVF